MTQPTVLGIDAGFAAMGVVVAKGEQIIHAATYRTQKADKKQAIRVADDDTDRCQQLARFLLNVIYSYSPAGAVVEMPSGGAQGARANRSMGMATGVVAAVLEITQTPFEVVTPQAVKKAATGLNNGSKEEVEATVRERFNWGNHLPKSKAEREHIADAAGALLAAQNGTLMRVLAQGVKGG